MNYYSLSHAYPSLLEPGRFFADPDRARAHDRECAVSTLASLHCSTVESILSGDSPALQRVLRWVVNEMLDVEFGGVL